MRRRKIVMPREIPPFDLDFLVAAEDEMRVRQATQDTRLETLMLPSLYDHVWERDTRSMEREPASESLPDEEYATVWEITLERL
jgi:hypothetical protein